MMSIKKHKIVVLLLVICAATTYCLGGDSLKEMFCEKLCKTRTPQGVEYRIRQQGYLRAKAAIFTSYEFNSMNEATFDENTPIRIQAGNFSFSGRLGDASDYKEGSRRATFTRYAVDPDTGKKRLAMKVMICPRSRGGATLIVKLNTVRNSGLYPDYGESAFALSFLDDVNQKQSVMRSGWIEIGGWRDTGVFEMAVKQSVGSKKAKGGEQYPLRKVKVKTTEWL